jgi:hypothetical protein
MYKAYFKPDPEKVYVIIKVDNVIVLRHARITQILENPLSRYIEGEMTFSSDGVMRASW